MNTTRNSRLPGKVAVVTGAASGIGRATADLFAANGCRVLAVDLPGHGLGEAFAGNARVACLEADLADADAPRRVIDAVNGHFGQLDVLVNNAGICIGASFEDTTDAIWERTFAVNVTSILRLSRAALELLKKSSSASIINLGSIMSDMAGPGLCAYGSSKHAVAGLSKAMAVDLGKYRITVNYLQPGSIITGLSKPFLDDPSFGAFFSQNSRNDGSSRKGLLSPVMIEPGCR